MVLFLLALLLGACGPPPCVPITNQSWKIVFNSGTEMIVEAPHCVAPSNWGSSLKAACYREYSVTENGDFCSRSLPFFEAEIAGLILLEGE